MAVFWQVRLAVALRRFIRYATTSVPRGIHYRSPVPKLGRHSVGTGEGILGSPGRTKRGRGQLLLACFDHKCSSRAQGLCTLSRQIPTSGQGLKQSSEGTCGTLLAVLDCEGTGITMGSGKWAWWERPERRMGTEDGKTGGRQDERHGEEKSVLSVGV
ncbi:hypothetical protein QR685DRAFT_217961 [Neurospora intermedia]|uniref:Uncharacterized protein n=1 Tax=Neurospora intermedia TaxID=5142 RepID=A0ABR3DJC1_NEUIN